MRSNGSAAAEADQQPARSGEDRESAARGEAAAPCASASCVDELVASARAACGAQGDRARGGVAPDVPEIHADRDALEKVIVNLMGNALKFTESERPHPGRARAEAGDGVHLCVDDSGIGIPPDQVERIFDRFAQVDGSTTRRHEGTGIGLSLVQGAGRAARGARLGRERRRGRGTQIHVVLPPGESDIEGDDAVEEARARAGRHPGARRHRGDAGRARARRRAEPGAPRRACASPRCSATWSARRGERGPEAPPIRSRRSLPMQPRC